MPELSTQTKGNVLGELVTSFQKELEDEKTAGERAMLDLKVFMENLDAKTSEARAAQVDMKRQVLSGWSEGKSTAGQLQKWWEDRLRRRESTVEKTENKNAQLQQQLTKAEQQVQQRNEMGESLHFIDLDQLKIENQQYLEKIEERNKELLKLKLTTGNIVQTLNTSKKLMNRLTEESRDLSNMIQDQKNAIAVVTEDIEKIQRDKIVTKRSISKLQKDIGKSVMPEVLDYVRQKIESEQLSKTVRALEKQAEIKMQLRSYKSKSTTILK